MEKQILEGCWCLILHYFTLLLNNINWFSLLGEPGFKTPNLWSILPYYFNYQIIQKKKMKRDLNAGCFCWKVNQITSPFWQAYCVTNYLKNHPIEHLPRKEDKPCDLDEIKYKNSLEQTEA